MEIDPNIYNSLGITRDLADDSYRGYRYIIRSCRGDHPCCYIQIPEDHPWYLKTYRNMEDEAEKAIANGTPCPPYINVHGGITYTDNLNMRNTWWIGWDYAHMGDYCHAFAERFGRKKSDHVYTVDELIHDVHDAIDQLILAFS